MRLPSNKSDVYSLFLGIKKPAFAGFLFRLLEASEVLASGSANGTEGVFNTDTNAAHFWQWVVII